MTKFITAILIAIATTTTLQAGYISCECKKTTNAIDGYYSYDISDRGQIKEYNTFKKNNGLTCKRYNMRTETSKAFKYC